MPLRSQDNTEADCRKDMISHFILRLAYCRTEDLRRWFLNHECILLKHRFVCHSSPIASLTHSLISRRVDRMTDQERSEFMAAKGLIFDQVSSVDKEARRDKLIGLAGVDANSFHSAQYCRVPFLQALSMVSFRAVYMEGGFAYVPVRSSSMPLTCVHV